MEFWVLYRINYDFDVETKLVADYFCTEDLASEALKRLFNKIYQKGYYCEWVSDVKFKSDYDDYYIAKENPIARKEDIPNYSSL